MQNPSSSVLPTDLTILANHLKARISYVPFESSEAGRIILDKQGPAEWIIAVNKSDTKPQQRATIAHLLGFIMWSADHLKSGAQFDHAYNPSVLICARAKRAAVKFAKTHLLPEPAVRATIKASGTSAAMVAKEYCVPLAMVEARLRDISVNTRDTKTAPS